MNEWISNWWGCMGMPAQGILAVTVVIVYGVTLGGNLHEVIVQGRRDWWLFLLLTPIAMVIVAALLYTLWEAISCAF